MESGNLRTPIVVVLGHVDHGKTTLLDTLRKTNVASKEAGGITQATGASVVTTKSGKKITFIDTPGHAAFKDMRSRGTRVADIAILVVASDDGVKPQTKEALDYIKESGIPFIVAGTKIDLPSASIETVKGQLEKEGILFEGRGGDIPFVALSSKTGQGLDELLDTISLVSEMNVNNVASDNSFKAYVIETTKSKGGPLVSIVVKGGTIKVGDEIVSENIRIKVRGLFDSIGKPVKEVSIGFPAQIMGFSNLPKVGSEILKSGGGKLNEDIGSKLNLQEKVKEDEIPVIIKTKSAGSLEAVIANLPEKVHVITSGVGDVTESDIFMAKSVNRVIVLVFEAKVPVSVEKLAETERVEIKTFDIIYKLFEYLDELIKGGKEEIIGKAQVIAMFPFNNKKIAGCKVLSGIISKGVTLNLIRSDKKVGSVRVISMKKIKQDIREAREGEEFGMIFEPQLDFIIGDVLVSLRSR